ncbi:hypothetical protein ABS767_03435 [Sphingomonas sp. ST-64]|uniref:Uncharacterized protein n=1 Tax=Sphingomonas plantiphila TaxID=3163295 RepID=A0ABW8YIB2_9SPHN
MTDPGKSERLAAALRENLRRRKSQARAVAQGVGAADASSRAPDANPATNRSDPDDR